MHHNNKKLISALKTPKIAPFTVTFEIFVNPAHEEFAYAEKNIAKLEMTSPYKFTFMRPADVTLECVLNTKRSIIESQKAEYRMSENTLHISESDRERYRQLKRYFSEKIRSLKLEDPLILFDDKCLRIAIGYGRSEFHALFSDFCNPGGVFHDTLCPSYSYVRMASLESVFSENYMKKEYEESVSSEIKRLLAKADKFFVNQLRVTTPTAYINHSGRDGLFIKEYFMQYKGLVVGEAHDHYSPKQFIIENLSVFKQEGISTIYIEHLLHERHQVMLDEYYQSPVNSPMPRELKLYLKNYDRLLELPPAYSMTEVVRAAKDNRIRVVAIDSEASYSVGAANHIRDLCDNKGKANRCKVMNVLMLERFNQYDDGKKYLIFVGSFHATTHYNVPGISELILCPAITIDDASIEAKRALSAAAISSGLSRKQADIYFNQAWICENEGKIDNAKILYKKSAKLGCIKANTNLATLYLQHDGSNQYFMRKAYDLLSKSARCGHERAQYNLSLFLENGNGPNQGDDDEMLLSKFWLSESVSNNIHLNDDKNNDSPTFKSTFKEILDRYSRNYQFTKDPIVKANQLFDVMLAFMKEKRWKYMPERYQNNGILLLAKDCNAEQAVNCVELADAFIYLCKNKIVNIQEAEIVIIKNKPFKRIGEKFHPFCPRLQPFDDDNSKFNDNQAIFNKHYVVKLGKRYYDLVFSTWFDHIDAPFDDTPYSTIVSLIDQNNDMEASYLLRKHTDINIEQTFQGWTLLHRAADAGLVKTVCRLIEMGADTNMKSKGPFPSIPLQLLPLSSIDDFESRLFRKLSANVPVDQLINIKNEYISIFQSEMLLIAISLVMSGDLEGIQDLVAEGLNINSQNIDGWTMLHMATLFQKSDIVNWLIANHADANIYNNEGELAADLVYQPMTNVVPNYRRK